MPGRIPVRRNRFAGAVDDRLFFAQVREDPELEVAALEPAARKRIVVVSSGGCTALSLLAAGAGEVVAVDLNAAQNHLVELKASALAVLPQAEAIGFLGGWAMPVAARSSLFREVRPLLSRGAASYWDAHASALRRGALGAGITERFIEGLWQVIRTAVHGTEDCEQLLALRSLEAQRSFYADTWNTWKWRAFFELALNRLVFNKTYDPAFFANVENPSFAKHFFKIWEEGLTEVPIANNYFLHQMVTGSYPRAESALPRYLTGLGAETVRARRGSLLLVDGAYGDYLRSCEDGSVDGFVLSNICEWLTHEQTKDLFTQIVRTAAPGARLVFRNFVGWTEVPSRFASMVVEDRARGEALMKMERSLCQRRLAVCDVRPARAEGGVS
ncbi:MAG TPA: DUF3419 family protein [Polyangiaceae bacterium]